MDTKIKICKRCLLNSSMPNISINKDGLCSECIRADQDKNFYNTKIVSKYCMEMEDMFRRVKKKKNSYDILVRFSGGKDSSYLLHLLKNKYKLKPLAFSIMHPLVNNLASENMEKVAKKFNIDLIKFFIDEDLFKKFMKYGLLMWDKIGLGSYTPCRLCGFIRDLVSYNAAIKLNIPIITSGYDVVQYTFVAKSNRLNRASSIKEIHFVSSCMPRHNKYDPRAKIFRKIFGNKYNGSMYDINNFIGRNINFNKNNKFPYTIYPLPFLKYDSSLAFKELEKAGINKQKMDSAFTNCPAMPFFNYFTYSRYNSHMKILFLASAVRKDNFVLYRGKKRDRNEMIKLLNEYKKFLFYMIKNKKNQQIDNKVLYKKFSVLYKLLGKKYFDNIIKNTKRVYYYAEYFGVSL